ncbi:hypothetical protein [Motiliproteus sediminis]|uniref:hypothetical protein n=1 Tax=Motiliproteus sediminis TaxID=1468178 RepID=UPI001AEF4B11|nr:hypothetical protein [Motiliproteus sediminis]
MRKLLIVPLLLPLAGFAAVKGFYWYQVKTAVDDVVQQLAPFGSLGYDSLIAEFSGRAGIKGVSFHPAGQEAALTAESVIIHTDNWTWFLFREPELASQVLPNRLSLEIAGLQIDLASLADYSAMVAYDNERLGCEKAGEGGVPFWRQLGYQQLQSDLSAGYRFNPDNGYLTLSVAVDTPSLFSISFDGSVATGGRQLLASNASAVGRFSELSVKIADDSYNQRRNRYCADLNGESIASFVNRHVDLLDAQYRSQGVQFGAEVVDAYRRFLMAKGAMELRVVAKEPVSFARLGTAEITDFDYRLAVNGSPVSPVELSLVMPATDVVPDGTTVMADQSVVSADNTVAEPEAKSATGLSPLDESSEQSLQGTDATAETGSNVRSESSADVGGRYQLTSVKRTSKPSYQKVEVAALGDHIGQQMRVDTLNGHRIEGTLEAVIRNQLRVKQEFDGGEALLPVRFDLIRSVKVLVQ